MKNDKIKNQYRVNEQIRVREVRVVSDGGAEVMPTRKALDLARQEGHFAAIRTAGFADWV